MKRRESLQIMFWGAVGSALGKSVDAGLFKLPDPPGLLPQIIKHTVSPELVINSRRSYHSGYSGTLSEQVLANVLWATAKAPILGKSRHIYVALPDGVYEYDEAAHRLVMNVFGNQRSDSTTSFEVAVAGDLPEDAGAASHYGQLAAMAFWGSAVNVWKPVCCPKGSVSGKAQTAWKPAATAHMGNCYGALAISESLTESPAAQSSNQSLVAPSTDGALSFEYVIGNLRYGTNFISDEIDLEKLSQILWASYGCTPHTVSGSKLGLAVASASARYYLSGKVYLVTGAGVDRYSNRPASGQTTSGDHRIDRTTNGDRRAQLRQSLARLPATAPSYIVYCSATTGSSELIEAGYCGAGALLQATSLRLQGHLTAGLTANEQKAIGTALNIPSGELPLLVFSAGKAAGTGARGRAPETQSRNSGAYLHAAMDRSSGTVSIRYGIDAPGRVTLVIQTMAGKQVATIVDRGHSRGEFSVTWDATGVGGGSLAAGTYLCTLRAPTAIISQNLTVR